MRHIRLKFQDITLVFSLVTVWSRQRKYRDSVYPTNKVRHVLHMMVKLPLANFNRVCCQTCCFLTHIDDNVTTYLDTHWNVMWRHLVMAHLMQIPPQKGNSNI